MSRLDVLNHRFEKYAPRTWANASEGDVTVAFAVDFTTAGEKLTHKASGERYMGIELSMDRMNCNDALAAARQLFRFVRNKDARVLNIAGNGIYTLAKYGLSQTATDRFVASVLAKVHEHHPLKKVISGGQTGVDLSGAVAGVFLGLHTQVLLPNGFIQRGVDKVDRRNSEEEIRMQITNGANALQGRLLC